MMSKSRHEAVLSGVVEETEQLLRTGVNTDAVNSEGHTALYLAAQNGFRDIVSALLHGSAQSEPAQLGIGPLVAAAAGGHVATVLLLIEAMQEVGMDIDTLDDSGMTALQAAEAGGHSFAARCLRKEGASSALPGESPNPGTSTDLILAAQRRDTDVVRCLLESGADVTIRDSTGSTALHAAAASGCMECLGLILEAADDKLVNTANYQAQTPLLLAAASGHTDAVQLLLHRGASVDAADRVGRTALYIACKHGHAGVVQQLIEAGADISHFTKHGLPVMAAVQGGHTDVARVLIANGAPVDAALAAASSTVSTDMLETLLTAAALSGNATVLDLLLEYAAQQANSITHDSPPPMTKDQVVLVMVKSAIAVADSDRSDAQNCWAVMQKLLQAAANISRASTAAALQSTLPQQSFRVAAVFAKLWMQVSDALAAADSQPDVIKKMASLQRLVGRMAVAHKQQQDALQQESSAKTGPDQDTVMADMREKSQQQLLQLRHELATSRRDLQDVLQELHRAKQELCEKQAARSNPQDSSESGQAAYDVLHNRIASQQAALSTLQEKMHAKQTEYKSLEEKLALEVRAYEQLKSNRLQGEAALKLLQVQCKQQQDELLAYNTGRTQLELERTKFHSERDAWEAQQAERVAGNVRLQEQKAACRARLQEQQAEQKRFQERHLAIKRNLSTADYSKQRQLAAEQAQLEADQAQLAAGRAKLQEERVQFSKQIAAERFSMREAVKAARGERSLQIWRWCAIMLAWLVLFAICWLR